MKITDEDLKKEYIKRFGHSQLSKDDLFRELGEVLGFDAFYIEYSESLKREITLMRPFYKGMYQISKPSLVELIKRIKEIGVQNSKNIGEGE